MLSVSIYLYFFTKEVMSDPRRFVSMSFEMNLFLLLCFILRWLFVESWSFFISPIDALLKISRLNSSSLVKFITSFSSKS